MRSKKLITNKKHSEHCKNSITNTLFKTFTAVTLLFIISACSSGTPDVEIPEDIASLENLSVFPADSEPAHELTLSRETVFGDTEEALLSDWLTAHVDRHGRVFIGDNRETVIHLYNPDGTYKRQIGREGDGPGEYRGIGVMKSDDSYFYHLDRMTRRITRYDLDTFEIAGEIVVTAERDDDEAFFRSVQDFYLTDTDNYLIQFGMGFRSGRPDIDLSERKVTARMMNAETGEYTGEDLFSFQANEALVQFRNDGSMSVMGVPYKRFPEIHVNEGGIIHGWNEHFLISFYDLDGNYHRSVYYNYPNLPLNRNEVLKMYEDRTEPWKSMVYEDSMPNTWPSWRSFTVDDEGRIWVERTKDDLDMSEIHVLANTGELLGTLSWPRDNRITDIKNSYLYSLEETEDGLRELVKHQIQLN